MDASKTCGVLLMAVEKAMIGVGEPADASIDEVEIEIVNPEAVSIETPDGGMVIDFDPDMESEEDFGSNLAEYLEESELGNIKSELIGAFEADRSSRSDWEETYIKQDNAMARCLWCISSCSFRSGNSFSGAVYYGNLSCERSCAYTNHWRSQ